jgi:AraC-like DNA-binding protein
LLPVHRLDPGAALRVRVGYDPGLEAEAFRRIEALDFGGCREVLERLAAGIDPGGATEPVDRRAMVLMLHDLVQRVDRAVHSPSVAVRSGPDPVNGRDPVEHWERARRFAAVELPDEAIRLFVSTVSGLLAPLESAGSGVPPLVRRARTFIQENFQRKISLSSVADKMNVSSNHLSRQFRRETGMTLTSYIHRVRLRQARRLLAQGGRSISEVAYMIGYQNYRDFYRNCVKYEQASPSEVLRDLSARD